MPSTLLGKSLYVHINVVIKLANHVAAVQCKKHVFSETQEFLDFTHKDGKR